MATTPPNPQRPTVTIDILDLIVRWLRRWKLVLLVTAITTLLAIGYALTQKPFYAAKSIFMPPPQRDSAVLSPTSGTSSLLFASAMQTDTYLAMLQSHSVQDDVVEHIHLMDRMHLPTRLVARAVLKGMSAFDVSGGMLMTVTINTGDPQLAADIANAYIEALYRASGNMVHNASLHRQNYYAELLKSEAASLRTAQEDLQQVEKRTGVLLPEGEAQAGLNISVSLQNQVNTDEVQLSTLLLTQTEQSPQVVSLRNQIAELRGQIHRQQGAGNAGQGVLSNGAITGLSSEMSEKLREVRRHETIYQQAQMQFDASRIGAEDPGPQLQVIEAAEVPQVKAGPSRKKFVLVGFLAGFLASSLWALFGGHIRFYFWEIRARLQQEA